MGFKGRENLAKWDAAENEVSDTTTLSFMGQIGFDISDTFGLVAGGGMAMSSNDLWDNDAVRTAFFAQAVMKGWGFRFVPEFGMMMEGDDIMDNEAGDTVSKGSLMYFGTQLRFDF